MSSDEPIAIFQCDLRQFMSCTRRIMIKMCMTDSTIPRHKDATKTPRSVTVVGQHIWRRSYARIHLVGRIRCLSRQMRC